ncbi:HAMP domain-containing sensor histidine kinase [Luteococcus peritonei]|uniref:histidine kinase n=1 Tax=Luteococcus peritonei TaxID=88874 RepID=A0ABW4RSX4_9ACTN
MTERHDVTTPEPAAAGPGRSPAPVPVGQGDAPRTPTASGQVRPPASELSPLGTMARGTLSRQLVLRVAALVTLLALLLGLASTIAVRHQLMGTVDNDLRSALQRSQRFDRGDGRFERPQPGTEVGQVTALSNATDQAGVKWIEGGFVRLTTAQTEQLLEAATGEPATQSLDGLGDYRVIKVSDGAVTQVVGLPLDVVNRTLRDLVLTELALTGLVLLSAMALAHALVTGALKPLNRLAATATEVSTMELDRGEVALPMRVAPADADPTNEVGRVGQAFNHMLNNVEGALDARQRSETKVRQFVADASHELRNPLAAIRGYAELTRRGREDLPTDTQYAMGRIEAESERMSRLVEDMLLLARLDNDPTLELQETDVVEVVLNAVSDARVASPAHRWGLDLPEGDVLARADALKLHQVVANLLANARKHTPEGTSVVTGVRAVGCFAEITVTDDGPGVDPSVKEHAFERFARADTARAHSQEGSTGLGLAIVAAVMEAHGGSASLDSSPGRTCFTLRVPLD